MINIFKKGFSFKDELPKTITFTCKYCGDKITKDYNLYKFIYFFVCDKCLKASRILEEQQSKAKQLRWKKQRDKILKDLEDE